jgi:hypothetical protein
MKKGKMKPTQEDCTISIGAIKRRARFIEWLPHYRCAVLFAGKRWTVNGLAVEMDNEKGNRQ